MICIRYQRSQKVDEQPPPAVLSWAAQAALPSPSSRLPSLPTLVRSPVGVARAKPLTVTGGGALFSSPRASLARGGWFERRRRACVGRCGAAAVAQTGSALAVGGATVV
ncbi:hypothetical protein ZWY2020_001160 [Hordeum vulgare]|nr:hypothetical protein ZWY2020_001160 [Hordeum vulgare]